MKIKKVEVDHRIVDNEPNSCMHTNCDEGFNAFHCFFIQISENLAFELYVCEKHKIELKKILENCGEARRLILAGNLSLTALQNHKKKKT